MSTGGLQPVTTRFGVTLRPFRVSAGYMLRKSAALSGRQFRTRFMQRQQLAKMVDAMVVHLHVDDEVRSQRCIRSESILQRELDLPRRGGALCDPAGGSQHITAVVKQRGSGRDLKIRVIG